MSHLYILTAPCRKGQYKIGIHTGNKADLISRYATYLYDPRVLLLVAIENAKAKESLLHKKLEKYVIYHRHSGRKSEWFKCSYREVDKALWEVCNLRLPMRNCICM